MVAVAPHGRFGGGNGRFVELTWVALAESHGGFA